MDGGGWTRLRIGNPTFVPDDSRDAQRGPRNYDLVESLTPCVGVGHNNKFYHVLQKRPYEGDAFGGGRVLPGRRARKRRLLSGRKIAEAIPPKLPTNLKSS
jgi:hypothetical protein